MQETAIRLALTTRLNKKMPLLSELRLAGAFFELVQDNKFGEVNETFLAVRRTI